ncbi:oocyte zinc finger protein XlCOF26-like, partial [Centruroides vittatus]|uniref:oocyte zinc finger protein XlCOF26-like n=1 Tax=Centruroides vittatus TaxID=120091 RepID=UPI0035106415
ESTSSDRNTSIECIICKNQFINEEQFDEHLKEYPNCKILTCEVCRKQFTSVYNLKTHNKLEKKRGLVKSLNRLMSTLLNMSTPESMQKEPLNRNEKEITSQSSETLWQCPQCRFTANFKEEWCLHKQTHIDEAPSTSMETEETDPEVLRAAEILVDIRKKTLEDDKR